MAGNGTEFYAVGVEIYGSLNESHHPRALCIARRKLCEEEFVRLHCRDRKTAFRNEHTTPSDPKVKKEDMKSGNLKLPELSSHQFLQRLVPRFRCATSTRPSKHGPLAAGSLPKVEVSEGGAAEQPKIEVTFPCLFCLHRTRRFTDGELLCSIS